MIFDGKSAAEEVKAELRERFEVFLSTHSDLSEPPKLVVVSLGNDPIIESFIKIKQKFGKDIGISVEVLQLLEEGELGSLLEKIEELNEDKTVGGIIVQLPLPIGVDKEKLLNRIVPRKDIDVLGKATYENFTRSISEGLGEPQKVQPSVVLFPPVVGAVTKILEKTGISAKGKKALVIGKGQLVGKPVAAWLEGQGAHVTSVNEGEFFEKEVKMADILVSGAGVPELLKPEMIKNGVVLIDAGTSESKGRLVGDADPNCAEKCSVFTPVPGGVGPLTVACLFENLLLSQNV